MIITLTANPSIDRSAHLPSPLIRGAVHRLEDISDEPGGKGVNVARALAAAHIETMALLPCAPTDPMTHLLERSGLNTRLIPTETPTRVNLTVTEADGTTTKLNAPGDAWAPPLSRELEDATVRSARTAEWVVLSGSLPPRADDAWYTRMVQILRNESAAHVAVDTSGPPLKAFANASSSVMPDLMKPNAFELASLTDGDGSEFEQAAAQGDFDAVITRAHALHGRGVRHVLVTLGAAGAVLVGQEGAWAATPPPITPISTVAAGDASLAGFLIGLHRGDTVDDCLARSVAYGSAAAALPGSGVPNPADLHLAAVQLMRL